MLSTASVSLDVFSASIWFGTYLSLLFPLILPLLITIIISAIFLGLRLSFSLRAFLIIIDRWNVINGFSICPKPCVIKPNPSRFLPISIIKRPISISHAITLCALEPFARVIKHFSLPIEAVVLPVPGVLIAVFPLIFTESSAFFFVLPLANVGFAVGVGHLSVAEASVIFPESLVSGAIVPDLLAKSLSLLVSIASTLFPGTVFDFDPRFIQNAVFPDTLNEAIGVVESSKAIFILVFPFSFIGAPFILDLDLSALEIVVIPLSLIVIAIKVVEAALAMAFVFDKFTRLFLAIEVLLGAKPVNFVVGLLTFVYSIREGFADASTDEFIIFPVAVEIVVVF